MPRTGGPHANDGVPLHRTPACRRCAHVRAAAAAVAVDEITPSRTSAVVAGAIADSLSPGVVTLTNFDVLPVSPAATPHCQDGIDNDDDGRIDFVAPTGGTADPDCVSATDNSEWADQQPECADGFEIGRAHV